MLGSRHFSKSETMTTTKTRASFLRPVAYKCVQRQSSLRKQIANGNLLVSTNCQQQSKKWMVDNQPTRPTEWTKKMAERSND